MSDATATQIMHNQKEENKRFFVCQLSGTKYFLRNEIVFGRKNCDVIIQNDSMVSGNHFKVTLNEREIYIEDLSSSNGTYLNGKKIVKKTQLKNGDKIKFGEQVFVVSDSSFGEEEVLLMPTWKASYIEGNKNFRKIKTWNRSTWVAFAVWVFLASLDMLLFFSKANREGLMFSYTDRLWDQLLLIVLIPLVFLQFHYILARRYKIQDKTKALLFSSASIFSLTILCLFTITLTSIFVGAYAKSEANEIEYYCGHKYHERGCFVTIKKYRFALKEHFSKDKQREYLQKNKQYLEKRSLRSKTIKN